MTLRIQSRNELYRIVIMTFYPISHASSEDRFSRRASLAVIGATSLALWVGIYYLATGLL